MSAAYDVETSSADANCAALNLSKRGEVSDNGSSVNRHHAHPLYPDYPPPAPRRMLSAGPLIVREDPLSS